MRVTRTILTVFILIVLVWGLFWASARVLENSNQFNQLSAVAFKNGPVCATNADFKKVKKGMSTKKVEKIMHRKGKLTDYRLIKDSHGVWRLKEVFQYRRCNYLLKEKSYKVVFLEDPNLTENHIITVTARKKYKLPV